MVLPDQSHCDQLVFLLDYPDRDQTIAGVPTLACDTDRGYNNPLPPPFHGVA